MFKITNSLKSKLIFTLIFLMLTQSTFLILSLEYSQFFMKLDDQILRNFDDTIDRRVDSLNFEFANVVQQVANVSKNISNNIERELENIKTSYSHEVFTNDIMTLLKEHYISEAFFILNKDADSYVTQAIYIKNTQPEDSFSSEHYELIVGPSAISQRYGIAVSSNWDIEFDFNLDFLQSGAYSFYEEPLLKSEAIRNSSVELFGYWSVSQSLFESNKRSVYYSLPVFDKFNRPIGVVGVSIDEEYFMNKYLPSSEIGYETGLYCLSNVNDNVMSITDEIPQSVDLRDTLKKPTPLTKSYLIEDDFYELKTVVYGDMFGKIIPLNMYSNNSPFIDKQWYLSSLVSKEEINQNSTSIRNLFLNTIIVITAFTCIISFVIANISMRKITGLSSYVRNLDPSQHMNFKKTNLREIDDLTNAVTMLNSRVIESSEKIEYILRMSDLSIGGYEVIPNNGGVIVTEYIYTLLEIEAGTFIDNDTWNLYHDELTLDPLDDQDDVYIYRYKDEDICLRILESITANAEIGMILDVTKEMKESIALQEKINFDELTKLYNRDAFRKKCKDAINKDNTKVGAMLFIDLDNLKYMNDTFGHETGDYLITSGANLFRRFQKYGGKVARNSGDEFTAFIYGFDSQDEIREIIQKERASFDKEKILLPNGEEQKIRFSLGVSWFPRDSEDVMQLLQYADFAMYQAKHNAKGTTREFDKKLHDESLFLLENKEKINKLLEDSLIYFVYQPIIDLNTGEIFAYEALMRSQLEEFKSAYEIIKITSEQSLLGKLEKVVLYKAAEDVYNRRKEFNGKKVLVNSVASKSIKPADYAYLNENYDNILQDMVLEITETDKTTADQMNEKVSLARNNGMLIGMNGFGNGYSNEMRVISISPDIIKIDMQLIQGISESVDKQLMVSGLINFCHSKDIKVIAHGVDVAADLETIVKLKIDYVQSFYLTKPSTELLPLEAAKKDLILSLRK